MTDARADRPHVVIVGGGVAGIEVATSLGRRVGRSAVVSLADFNGWGTLGRYTFGGGRLRGLSARLAHDLLYRQHQLGLLGIPRGLAAWVLDDVDHLISPPVRLD